MDCMKLTVVPYSPEFNPVERCFRTLKVKASDGIVRFNLLEITDNICYHMNKIPKNTFKNYFQLSLTKMATHIMSFFKLEDDNYTKPKDKLKW